MATSKENNHPSVNDYLKALPQYILPHHALSSVMYKLTRSRNELFKNWLIKYVVRNYNVDMSAAVEEEPTAYPYFNKFFTRPLKPEARPIVKGDHNIACPVDGTVSQAGAIEQGRIFQAKGRDYTLHELLGGNDEWAQAFDKGNFATIYLSPRDYHRIHCPLDGTLKEMIHVPGRLFSVSPATTRVVPRLFARNERVISIFETEFGPMAVILVGAIFVSSMDTVWAGTITPPAGKNIQHWNYADRPFSLKKGDEMGRFNMGSTVILLFARNKMQWSQTLQAAQSVQMGQSIGESLNDM
jgi:phosphatidylserine decarboxylase